MPENTTGTPTKAYKGIAMEGLIATWYAHTTNNNRDFPELARRMSAQVPAGGQVLEVAPGPGYLSIELAKSGKFHVTGLDISNTFVEIARKNAAQANVAVDFRQGNASGMPFPANSFDFIICTAAFKNFTDPVGAMNEMERVLKPGGKAVIIDLRRDASKEEIDDEVERMHLGTVNHFLTKWTFHNMLLRSAYSQKEIEAFLAQTRFSKTRVDSSGIGFEIWMEK
jgi:ubiquinone/menaquinone biosynthesis C-methylase UbiE